MRYAERAGAKTEDHYRNVCSVEHAIIEVLLSRDMRPGDSIDIILAQYLAERKGLSRNEFSAGVAQLMDLGLLCLRENRFYLTDAGFDVLYRVKVGRLPETLRV